MNVYWWNFLVWKSRKMGLAYKRNRLPFSQESPDHPSKQSHTPVVFLQTPGVVWSLIQCDGHAEESKKYLHHIMIWDNTEGVMLHSSSHSMFVHPIVCLFFPLCPNIYQIPEFLCSPTLEGQQNSLQVLQVITNSKHFVDPNNNKFNKFFPP